MVWYARAQQNSKQQDQSGRTTRALEHALEGTLPERHRGALGALRVHLVPEVELATALVDVDGREADAPSVAAAGDGRVDLVSDEEDDDDRAGEVVLEEDLDVEVWASDWLGGVLVGGLGLGGVHGDLRRGRRRRWPPER